MGDFNRAKRPGGRSFGGGNRGGFGGNRGGFGGGRDRGGFGGGRPQMHKATCSECGKECELPFRPSGDRPVFCSTCFEKQGGGNARPNNFGGGERRERPRFEDKQMHDAICAKCGKACQVPFRPMPGKDVFCDNCFEKGGNKDSGELMSEIKGLHVKLDRLIKFMAPNAPTEKVLDKKVVKEEIKKITKTKPIAKKALGKKKK